MKITVEHVQTEENEVILRCRDLDDEMLSVLALLRSGIKRLCVWDEEKNIQLIKPGEIVYCETVAERTFVYTDGEMYQTSLGLAELESQYAGIGFFRAGKSTIVNLHQISSLKSRPAGRIEAFLKTGERVLISRHYAPLLREQLEI